MKNFERNHEKTNFVFIQRFYFSNSYWTSTPYEYTSLLPLEERTYDNFWLNKTRIANMITLMSYYYCYKYPISISPMFFFSCQWYNIFSKLRHRWNNYHSPMLHWTVLDSTLLRPRWVAANWFAATPPGGQYWHWVPAWQQRNDKVQRLWGEWI